MTSDRLNWFLTIAANIGVVLGLGFLALELRQNTLATQATLHLDLVAYGRENAELLVSNDELAGIVMRGEQDPASLDPLEWEKFLLFIDDRYWSGFDAWYSEIVRGRPGYQGWWAESRHAFDPRFQEHVDGVFGSGP